MRVDEIGRATIIHGDCRTVLAVFPDASIDSVVTDPPYELGFMGKGWDSTGVAYDPTLWAEVLRILKPGGHLVSFGGSRTYHRMASAIEAAGFEIRDQIMWLYGSGFPKSHNGAWGGTALKPAHEPIVLARKPLIGTVETNWLAYGTGALNIDGCRVGDSKNVPASVSRAPAGNSLSGSTDRSLRRETGSESGHDPNVGRWPANVIHDGSDEVVAAFPITTSGTGAVKRQSGSDAGGNTGAALGAESRPAGSEMLCYGDSGSAARFFYCAKATKKDRNDGCAGLPARPSGMVSNTSGQHITRRDGNAPGPQPNNHPTVKPTALMRYLCRLVTPAGGTILDPFLGSGSTGKAAAIEGFKFVGIELEAEYFDVACARIRSAA